MDAADATTPEQPTRPLEPRSLNFDDVLPTDANLDSPFDDAALAEMAEGRLVHEGEGPALLTFDEFSRLTRENDHLDLSDAEIRGRFASLDPTGTGQVERRQWLQQALRDTLGRSISRILEIFFAWDVDGSGLIEPKEFRQAVRMLGFHAATNDEIDSVFAEFDVDADGSVTKMEIDRKLRKYAGVMAEQRYAIRTKAGGRKGAAFGVSVKLDRTSSTPVSDQLRHIFVENAVRVIDIFREWDEDGDGTVSREEFFRALTALGYTVSRPETDALFGEFDPDGSGQIEFNELYKLLRRGIKRSDSDMRKAKLAKQARSQMMRTWSDESVRSMRLHGPLAFAPPMAHAITSIGHALASAPSASEIFAGVSSSPLIARSGSGVYFPPSRQQHGMRASASEPALIPAKLPRIGMGSSTSAASLGARPRPKLTLAPPRADLGGADGVTVEDDDASGTSSPLAPPRTSLYTTSSSFGNGSAVLTASAARRWEGTGREGQLLPLMAESQAHRIAEHMINETALRASASASILRLPTSTHLVKEYSTSTSQSIDHLAQLWLQPRMGSYAALKKLPPAEKQHPVFLPPITAAKMRPARPPVISPALTQASAKELLLSHRRARLLDQELHEEYMGDEERALHTSQMASSFIADADYDDVPERDEPSSPQGDALMRRKAAAQRKRRDSAQMQLDAFVTAGFGEAAFAMGASGPMPSRHISGELQDAAPDVAPFSASSPLVEAA